MNRLILSSIATAILTSSAFSSSHFLEQILLMDPPKPIIGNLLGKDRADIEKSLGKPEKSGSSEDGYDWAKYKLAKTRGVNILYFATGEGLPKTSASEFTVSFERDVTWQKAAEILGMKPTKLKAKPLENIPALSQLIGDPYKDWNVYFSGANARYPAETGLGELINSEGGFPTIQFESRSINDDSPD